MLSLSILRNSWREKFQWARWTKSVTQLDAVYCLSFCCYLLQPNKTLFANVVEMAWLCLKKWNACHCYHISFWLNSMNSCWLSPEKPSKREIYRVVSLNPSMTFLTAFNMQLIAQFRLERLLISYKSLALFKWTFSPTNNQLHYRKALREY